MKRLLILSLLCVAIATAQAQEGVVQTFHLSSVRLLDSPFKVAEQKDLEYILALDPDKLLAPYLREAGLEPKDKSYGNWENSGLDGHIGGHYLTALSLMYASTGDKEVGERLNYMLNELKKCQDANGNGYIGGVPGSKAMWDEIAQGKINAGSFSLNGKWVPWYNIHKVYAGLRDAYLYTHNELAKEMLIKLSDWALVLVQDLTDEQIQQMLHAEYGGMNEVFADVAAITGEDKYLELAKKFSHHRILNPLLQGQDQLTGLHANTQIPKVIGYKRIADLEGNKDWDDASKFFWETVVENRTVAIGGNSVREHFHPSNDFYGMITDREGPETCNTYNMLKLSMMLYLSTGSLEYLDFYERGLYNHILSTQHPEKGGFVYFTSMRPRHYRIYSQPETSFWCCVGSGIENHAKYGELIYAHTDQDLLVNLFIPSTLDWSEKGVSIIQETAFPDNSITNIKVNPKKSLRFNLKVRYPNWVEKGTLKVMVNGKEHKFSANPGEYVSIERKWKAGDEVTVILPMQTTLEQMPDKSPYFAVLHGPIVLAAKTDTTDLVGLFADDSRMGHIAHGPLYPMEGAPMLVGEKEEILAKIKPVQGKTMTFEAPDLIQPHNYSNVELIPFFRLHEARYVLYWQHATEAELEAIQEENRRLEKERMALESLTIDKVAPGEQQPESDHFFKGENTESGIYKDRHWRHARGWFSYDLNNKDKETALLQVTYNGQDSGRNFDILINEERIATVKLDGSQGDKFYAVNYAIPMELINKAVDGKLVVKFEAHPGSIAGGVFDVRLVRIQE